MKTYYSISPTNHGWGYGYGFFSNYRICLEQLIDHHENKREGIPYIDWDKTTWIEGFNPFESTEFKTSYNPFDDWFYQDIPSSMDLIIKCTNPPRPDIINHAEHYFYDKIQLERQQSIDRLYIKPKEHITQKINQIYEKELNGHNVLGVMARGTEYNLHHPMYGVFGVDDYIKEIDKILNSHPEITKLLIVSEDSEYIDKIAKAFPSNYFLPDVFRKTDESMEYINTVHCWPNVSTKRKNHCKLLGEEVIIQTKLLGKCDYLFGRLSGILTGAVLWNENLKNIFKI